MKVHKLLACYGYFCKQNVFKGAIKLECLRTIGPSFRTYEPSDYRTFITESCKSRYRTYEPSDCRTFGMKNPLFRTYEPSDYRTFGLGSSHLLLHIALSVSSPALSPVLFKTRWHASSYLVFGRPLIVFTRRPYIRSQCDVFVISPDHMHMPVQPSLGDLSRSLRHSRCSYSFLILSFRVTHRSILMSFTSIRFSVWSIHIVILNLRARVTIKNINVAPPGIYFVIHQV